MRDIWLLKCASNILYLSMTFLFKSEGFLFRAHKNPTSNWLSIIGSVLVGQKRRKRMRRAWEGTRNISIPRLLKESKGLANRQTSLII